MSNVLIFSDLHIEKQSLTECSLILDEIVSLCKTHKLDLVEDLGDTFDVIKPESECLDLFSNFIKKINIPIRIIAANSHESTSSEESIMNHFSILHPNVTVVKEWNDDKMYLGHFMVNESLKGKYGGTCSKNALVQYSKVFLGHQHSWEHIEPNIWQIGSVRYISFDEVKDPSKKVVLIKNYGQKDENIEFLDLKSPYPMTQVILSLDPSSTPKRVTLAGSVGANSGVFSEIIGLQAVLDELSAKTKVKVIFKDFKGYRDFLPLIKTYKDKFVIFKEHKDFILELKENKEKNILPLKDRFESWALTNKIEVEVKNILLEELK